MTNVSNVTLDENGDLVLHFNNGTTRVLGNISNPNERNLENAYINAAGDLILTYSDGISTNLGNVKGRDGINGKDGVSVLSAVVDKDGNLQLVLSNGQLLNAGLVVGPKGENGKSAYALWIEQGNTVTIVDFLESLKGDSAALGKVVKELTVNENGDLVINYTDGAVQIIKAAPNADAIGITDASVDQGGNLIIVLSNGSIINAGNVREDNQTASRYVVNVMLDDNRNLLVVYSDFSAEIIGKLCDCEETPGTKEPVQPTPGEFTPDVEVSGEEAFVSDTDVSGGVNAVNINETLVNGEYDSTDMVELAFTNENNVTNSEVEGEQLPDTATMSWLIGLAGFSTLSSGLVLTGKKED